MKRALVIVAVLLVGAALLLLWKRARQDPAETVATNSATGAAAANPGASSSTRETTTLAAPGVEADGPILLANNLNRPDGTIAKDLRIVEDLLDAWRSNFPRNGNPWGENAEIAASLSGQNSLHLVLIPRNHIAFNPAGELCDRWGTPFRFHALSSNQMEVRSAGPDRKFGTDDDATISP